MKNMCYYIGADLSNFPLLFYHFGTLERIHFENRGSDSTLTIQRKATSPSVQTDFAFRLSKYFSFRDDIVKNLTINEYVVLLLSACELHAGITLAKENLQKNLAKFYSIKGQYEKVTSLFEALNIYYKKNPELTEANKFEFENKRLPFPNENIEILLDSVTARISSDESQVSTHLSFMTINPRMDNRHENLSKVYTYKLPDNSIATGNSTMHPISSKDLKALINLIGLLYDYLSHLSHFSDISLRKSVEIENTIKEADSSLFQFIENLEDLKNVLKENKENYDLTTQNNQREFKDALHKKEGEIQSLKSEIGNLEFDKKQKSILIVNLENNIVAKDKYVEKTIKAKEDDFNKLIENNKANFENQLRGKQNHYEELIKSYEYKIEALNKNNEEEQKRTENKHSTELEKLRTEINRLEEKITQQSDTFKTQIYNSQERNKWTLEQSEEKIKKVKQDLATELAVAKSHYEAELKGLLKKHSAEMANNNTSFQKTIESLNQLIREQSRKIDELQSQVSTVRQNMTDEIVSQRILDNSFFTHAPSNWDRNFFDELSIRLDRLGQIEETQNHQQILLEIQKFTNEAKLSYEINKTENQRYLAEVMQSKTQIEQQINQELINRASHVNLLERSDLELNKKKFHIEEQIRREELNRGEQDLKIDRAVLDIDQKKSLIESQIRKEELSREGQDLKIDRAVLDIDQKKSLIENEIRKEELSREGQDLKIDRAVLDIDQKKSLIESQIRKEELSREEQDLKIDRAVLDIDQKKSLIESQIRKEELSREEQDHKNDKAIFDVEQKYFAIDSRIKQEELNREKHKSEMEREQMALDKKQMQIDFISLRNELKAESLSMREFAMQKTNEYQKFEITAKENLLKVAEMINLQEAKNLQGEKTKLEVAGKLAEMGIQVREQNVHLQRQMNEIEQKNIKNDRQLLEMNKEKMDVQNMLAQGKLDFQKNQNDLTEMMLKIKDGEFKNAASSLLIELNKKHFENDIQLQNIGLVQRENETTLKGRENDIRSIHLTNQSVVNNLLSLQKENKLFAQMEAQRQSYYNVEQNLQSRIWSLQNSLERSQIDLSNERALRKYLNQ
jgi:hypothetical protein